jgi:hypothetical protein
MAPEPEATVASTIKNEPVIVRQDDALSRSIVESGLGWDMCIRQVSDNSTKRTRPVALVCASTGGPKTFHTEFLPVRAQVDLQLHAAAIV